MNLDGGERWLLRHVGYYTDPDAAPEALLNDATEWLSYARGTAELLAELVFEADEVNARRMSLALDGIAALMDMSTRCVAQAQGRILAKRAKEGR